MVRLYLECRRTNTYPSPGGPMHQTAFAMDLFDYLDHIFEDQREKIKRQQSTPGVQKLKKAGA